MDGIGDTIFSWKSGLTYGWYWRKKIHGNAFGRRQSLDIFSMEFCSLFPKISTGIPVSSIGRGGVQTENGMTQCVYRSSQGTVLVCSCYSNLQYFISPENASLCHLVTNLVLRDALNLDFISSLLLVYSARYSPQETSCLAKVSYHNLRTLSACLY